MTNLLATSAAKDKLIKISTEYFVKFGYKSTSLSKIAEEANIDKSTLYHYFDSKSDIAKQVIMNMEERHEKHLFSIIHKKGVDNEDKVIEFISVLKMMIIDACFMVAPVFMVENIPELGGIIDCHRQKWVMEMKLLLSPLYSAYYAEKFSQAAWMLVVGAYMEIRAESNEEKIKAMASNFESTLKGIWSREII